MKLHAIDTGHFKLDGGAMFGVVPKTLWSKLCPADTNNMCALTMRCMLIKTKDKNILIDSGLGDKQSKKFFSYYYLHGDGNLIESLARHGVSPEEITDVVLTHLHFDHCGGCIKIDEENSTPENPKYIPSFANATYHIGDKQWQWAIEPNRRERASFLKENILPIQESGQLNLIKTPDDFTTKITLFDSIYCRFCYGHTEGQMIPFIEKNGTTIVFVSDLIPTTANIALPYIPSYDVRPLITLREKELFLSEAVENDYILFFEHDIETECCTLQFTEKGIHVDKTFRLIDTNLWRSETF